MKTLGKIVVWLLVAVVALAVVGWLALRRPDLPWQTLEAKYAGEQSRYMDLPGGVRVHYRDEGNREGPTIVLVHGFSASLHAWEPWARSLGDHYRVITLDLPGHGLTRAPADYSAWGSGGYVQVVDQVTAKLGAQRFVLGGNSMGGGVAWIYALAHPEKLDGLVLVDAAGWPGKPGGDVAIFKILRHPIGRAVVKDLDARALTKQGLEAAYGDPKFVTPALLDRYVDLARAPGHRDILIGLQGVREAATAEKLAAIKVPTLVMHGREDRLIPFADGERFAQAIPDATLIAYDGVGHVPMETIPDRSVADLRQWLETKVWPAT